MLVSYRGLPYRLDLQRCRRALAELQIEGELDGIRGLATNVGMSLSTTSRFFSGRQPSMPVILRILEALHLTFDEVATEGDDEGPAGLRVRT